MDVLERMGADVAVVPGVTARRTWSPATVAAAGHRGARRPRSPPSTRSPSWRWPRRRPTGPTVFTGRGGAAGEGVRPPGRRGRPGAGLRGRGRGGRRRPRGRRGRTGWPAGPRGHVDSGGDHRMAMAAAVAALAGGTGESTVGGIRRGGHQLPGLRRRPGPPGRGGPRDRPRAGGCCRHRRPGRLGQVDRLAGAGRAPRARTARHRGHVPGRGLGSPRPGAGPGRSARPWPPSPGTPTSTSGRARRIDGVDVTDGHPLPRGEPGRLDRGRQSRPSGAELVRRQRRWAEDHGGGVVEGRDIGTVVFPDADVKVYLTAIARGAGPATARRGGGRRGPARPASTPPGPPRPCFRRTTPACSTPPVAASRTWWTRSSSWL